MYNNNNNNSAENEKGWRVVTSDNEVIETTESVMKMFESLVLESSSGDMILDITSEQMKFIIKFTTLYQQYRYITRIGHTNPEGWEKALISELNHDQIFQLTLVANKFGIKPLLDMTCCYVASLIKGKTPEEIRRQFAIRK